MDDCPFHDLPPGETVHVQVGNGPSIPRTAQQCCDDWHTAKALEPVFTKADRVLAGWLDDALRNADGITPPAGKAVS